ncbi:MAG: hypothetical protein ACI9LM_000007 [Alteromonadaceae bacterium]|jgi:hypothetical protein
MGPVSINTFSNTALDNIFNNILCKNVAYFAKGIIYSFVKTETGVQLVPDLSFNNKSSIDTENVSLPKLPIVLIVGREYYQEQFKTYPISNKKELDKLLKLEFLQSNVAYRVSQQQENTSNVNVWSFDANLPAANIIIPESFLLSHTIAENEILHQQRSLLNDANAESDNIDSANVGSANLENTSSADTHLAQSDLFIALLNKSTVSLLSRNLINTSTRFCASVGVNEGVVTLSNNKEFANRLIKGVKQCPLTAFQLFKRKLTTKHNSAKLKIVGLTAIAVFALYMAISSAGLLWQKKSLENQLSLLQSTVNQALSIQNKYNEKTEKLTVLADIIDQQKARSYLWLILSTVIEDVNIKTLRFDSNNNRYIMIGRTMEPASESESDNIEQQRVFRSTDLLAKIIQQDFVEDAKFDAEIRGINQKESFTVSFLINPKKINKLQEGEG